MPTSPVQLPDLKTLTQKLNAAFNDPLPPGDKVAITARESNPHTSTYPSEILTCQLADGSEKRFLCKYSNGHSHYAYGHRGGLAYEAKVYRNVLQTSSVSIPAFYGLHKDEITNQTWIIIEYIDNSVQVRYSQDRNLDRTLMVEAAHWLGRFHKVNESRLSPDSIPFLHRHDADYYLGWADRTSRFAGPLHQGFPWLATLCTRFEEVVEILLEPPAIIVHGEYYPNNILFRQGTIYPVDWESTAVAIGEIDFASLTEHWPSAVVERCKAEYLSARWLGATPADFEKKLDVAKLYWRFRWLGERPDWTTEEKSRWRFEDLRVLGERLGLI